ncbi:MAG: polysaccharide biosynthesis protein, partial [Pseudomonadota bacterium]|nr:polysaccharide biosynthesis protein [Pseudomonadota bacterium]
MAARSLIRIVVNVALDGGLAALAVPLARWFADPTASHLQPLWTLAAGAATLLLAGVPFRLSLQYWRFAGLGDLLQVAGSSALGAVLFAATVIAAGAKLPTTAFPAVHALVLLVLLGAPRVIYRRLKVHPPTRFAAEEAAGSALVVGAAEDADLFLRALAQDRSQTLG